MARETESDFQKRTADNIHRIDNLLARSEEKNGRLLWKGTTYTSLFRTLIPGWQEGGFQSTLSFALASPALKNNHYDSAFRTFSIKLHSAEDEADQRFDFVFVNDQPPLVLLDEDNDSKKTLPVNKIETLDGLLAILDVLPEYSLDSNNNLINKDVSCLIEKISQKSTLLTLISPMAIPIQPEDMAHILNFPKEKQHSSILASNFHATISGHQTLLRAYLHPEDFPKSLGKNILLELEPDNPPWYLEEIIKNQLDAREITVSRPASYKQLDRFNKLSSKALEMYYLYNHDRHLKPDPTFFEGSVSP